jgi:formylglycine-generating enzyme required for sulfatase activity
MRLGRPEHAWKELRHQPDPRLATGIIHTAAAWGVAPTVVAERLEREPSADVRRSLLLLIGKFPTEQLESGLRQRLAQRLWGFFRSDPDAGVHSASEWLLRRWGADAEVKRVAAELCRTPPTGASWFVNSQMQTFSAFQGPVNFIMGAPAYLKANLVPGEASQHRRHIPRSFAIATKEVTNAEYGKFLEDNPDQREQFDAEFARVSPDPDGPVCGVTWYSAVRYCRWLSAKEGIPEDQQCYPAVQSDANGGPLVELKVGYLVRRGYRLPTEAEWEYAARANTITSRSYGWTDALLGEYEWCHLQSSLEAGPARPVGRLMPNPFGMFDMLGNVQEWSTNYTDFPPQDKDGLVRDLETPGSIGGVKQCFIRGGERNEAATMIHSSLRVQATASVRSVRNGFRIARTLP